MPPDPIPNVLHFLPHRGPCSEPSHEIQSRSPLMPGVPKTSSFKTLLYLLAFSVRMTSDSSIEVTMTSWPNIVVTSLSSAPWSPNLFYKHLSRLLGHSSLLISALQLPLLLPVLLFPLLCLPSGCWCSPDRPWTLFLLVNVLSLELLIQVLTSQLVVCRTG